MGEGKKIKKIIWMITHHLCTRQTLLNIIVARMELKTLSIVKIRAENWYSSPINQSLTLVAAVTKTLVRVHNVAKEHRKKLISAIAISKNMP